MKTKEEYLRDLKKWLEDTADAPLEEMSDFFKSRLHDYEEHMSVWEKSYQVFAEQLPTDCRKILDLGCGTGLELDRIWKKDPRIEVTGVDLCREMLDKLLAKHGDKRFTAVCQDYFQYDFGCEAWDAVISFESLHHFLPEQKETLYRKIRGSLKDGGVFLLGDYIACCDEEEALLRGVYLKKRQEQAIAADCYVHFDIPLTLEHETEIMENAGFVIEQALDNPDGATIILAKREIDHRKDILNYAKDNMASFETVSVSSNEIRFFEYDGKKYVLKTPLMTGDHLSPFWLMMKKVFHFSFAGQNAVLGKVCDLLKQNPHIRVSPFVIADESAMIYECVEGTGWSEDAFPKGKDNAYRLGQYVGYHHQTAHKNCGMLGIEDVTDFFLAARSHMEECIRTHWNGDDPIDQRMRAYFEKWKGSHLESGRYSLMMADISADQFLFDGEDIAACVDLDAYVIGPVEWELSFLQRFVGDWDRFQAGYETYQKMPALEEISGFFYYIMALNSYQNKSEIEMYWSDFL